MGLKAPGADLKRAIDVACENRVGPFEITDRGAGQRQLVGNKPGDGVVAVDNRLKCFGGPAHVAFGKEQPSLHQWIDQRPRRAIVSDGLGGGGKIATADTVDLQDQIGKFTTVEVVRQIGGQFAGAVPIANGSQRQHGVATQVVVFGVGLQNLKKIARRRPMIPGQRGLACGKICPGGLDLQRHGDLRENRSAEGQTRD